MIPPSTTASSFLPAARHELSQLAYVAKLVLRTVHKQFGWRTHADRKIGSFTGAPIPISRSTRASHIQPASHPATKLKPASNSGLPENSAAKNPAPRARHRAHQVRVVRAFAQPAREVETQHCATLCVQSFAA